VPRFSETKRQTASRPPPSASSASAGARASRKPPAPSCRTPCSRVRRVKCAFGSPGRVMPLTQVSAMLLGELKLDAEAHFGRPVSKAVITVPANFDEGQRQATREAARIAGLEVLRLLNEPTAAAMAYGLVNSFQGRALGVRPRRRHLRRLGPRDGERRLRGEGYRRRPAARRRRLRRAHRAVARRAGARPAPRRRDQRPRLDAAPSLRRRAREANAVRPGRGLHLGGRARRPSRGRRPSATASSTPRSPATSFRRSRAAHRALHRGLPLGARRSEADARRRRGRDARRWHDPHAAHAAAGARSSSAVSPSLA
jgi:hypothetical protein